MTIFGEEKLQRCTVHKTENILKKCPKNMKEELKAKLHQLWNRTTRLALEFTTNLIERVIREVRRRTKVMDNVIENEYSVYALMTGIFQEQNERWNKKSHWSGK